MANLDSLAEIINMFGGNKKPKYGQEVARPTAEQALAGLINAIQSYRKDNPITLPFPAGTPTLAARQFAEQQKQNEISNQLSRQSQGRIAGNQAFSQKMDIWRATGRAPEGIPGVQPGTPYGGTQEPTGMDPLDMAKLYGTALDLVKTDPEYFDLENPLGPVPVEGANIQEGIEKWMNKFTGNIPESPFKNISDPVQKAINQLIAVGASPMEIRKALVEDGYDPSKYGY